VTDRTLRSIDDLADLRFDDAGLLPVVAQDADDGAILMVAWANRDALAATLETGQVHFWSRSRGELWRKGETSGNTLTLVSLHADCDGDTLLALVRPAGPACHTGERTCFGEGARVSRTGEAGGDAGGRDASDAPGPDVDTPDPDTFDRLDSVLRSRAVERPEGSYTTKLLGDENLRLKKLGEEAAELVAALAKGDRERSVEEAADLVYHLLVALRAEGLTLDDVRAALSSRAR